MKEKKKAKITMKKYFKQWDKLLTKQEALLDRLSDKQVEKLNNWVEVDKLFDKTRKKKA